MSIRQRTLIYKDTARKNVLKINNICLQIKKLQQEKIIHKEDENYNTILKQYLSNYCNKRKQQNGNITNHGSVS